ncbi:hypothetical protein [Sorangium sp. So ce1000]|uniref:hypothetical protein n=1 Tax=Sorangium sp. So ce1000 TaxID=3133325 RepID=UPI003F5DA812
MYFRLDHLGKNILRDFFVLVGAAETEVEVPADRLREDRVGEVVLSSSAEALAAWLAEPNAT